MKSISFILIAALLALGIAAPNTVLAADETRREARVELARDMANVTMSILKDQRQKTSERQELLKNSFAKVVDTDWIARFVLGSAWRTATAEQKERYTELYRQYLTHIYVSTYAENPGRMIRDIKVVDVNDANNNNFVARTQVVLSTAETLDVDYLVAEREEGNKIIDVVIENVSLLNTHRGEFSRLAADAGVDGVIRALEKRLATAPMLLSMSDVNRG